MRKKIWFSYVICYAKRFCAHHPRMQLYLFCAKVRKVDEHHNYHTPILISIKFRIDLGMRVCVMSAVVVRLFAGSEIWGSNMAKALEGMQAYWYWKCAKLTQFHAKLETALFWKVKKSTHTLGLLLPYLYQNGWRLFGIVEYQNFVLFCCF